MPLIDLGFKEAITSTSIVAIFLLIFKAIKDWLAARKQQQESHAITTEKIQLQDEVTEAREKWRKDAEEINKLRK